MTRNTHIAVLLATCNGAAHLSAQLESLVAQSHQDWSLWCSDDGSSDNTLTLLDDFRIRHPEHSVHVFLGPCQGSAANFMSLLCQPGLPDGHLAFCDQDDVWMPHRLARALEHLSATPPTSAGRLYASRTVVVDEELTPLAVSTKHPKPPEFGNALVQNILAGNTMVADPAAAQLLRRTARKLQGRHTVPFHDWWIYQITTAAGVQIVLDDEPGLYYRQHGDNVLGSHRGLRKSLARLRMIAGQEYASWVTDNLAALHHCQTEITPMNRTILDDFHRWRHHHGPIWRRPPVPPRIHRQTAVGNVALMIMGLSRRL